MRQGRLCRQVWTPELEFFVGRNTSSCRSVPCRSRIWPHRLQSSSSPWTCWLSLDQRGSVGVQIPCEKVFRCRAGIEAVGWWSGHGCCAGTLLWRGGCTSRPTVCSQRAGGTDLTLDWRAPSVCQFEGAMLWKTPTLSLVSNRVLWWNALWIEVRGPRLHTLEGRGASRLNIGRAWLLLLLSPSCASEWSALISTLSPSLSSLRRDQRRGGVLLRSPH